MKKTIKYFVVIVSATFFSANTIAQAPPDPGGDPLKTDSTKQITGLQIVEPIHLNIYTNHSSVTKNSAPINSTTETALVETDKKNLQRVTK